MIVFTQFTDFDSGAFVALQLQTDMRYHGNNIIYTIPSILLVCCFCLIAST